MRNKYNLAVFDLDGTILDTTEGIISALEYTIEECGLEKIPTKELLAFIGPPIEKSFESRYGLSGRDLEKAASVFRERYKTNDLLKAKPYDGIFELIDNLDNAGIKCAVATYKREEYALRLLKHFGFDKKMTVMHGSDNENKLSKTDIIRLCITESKTACDNALMIGDTDNDAFGAEKVPVDFLAVSYGFGFKSKTDIRKTKCIGCADKPTDILNFITGD